MPIGAALALLLGPWLYDAIGWRWSWAALSALSLCWAAVVCSGCLQTGRSPGGAGHRPGRARLRQTLTASGPWLVALAFFSYSGQWLAVVGFLPTMQTQAGWSIATVGIASAAAAGANASAMSRQAACWRMAGRQVVCWRWPMSRWRCRACWLASGLVGPSWQLLLVMVFSGVGGLIPGTLFGLAVRLAPSAADGVDDGGWVQQLSSLGQFAGPPLVASLVAWQGAGTGRRPGGSPLPAACRGWSCRCCCSGVAVLPAEGVRPWHACPAWP